MENDFDDEGQKETEMEKKFIAEFEAVQPQFEALKSKIRDTMKEMVDLSHQTGIPFEIYVAGAGNSFIPKGFREKYPDLDEDFLCGHIRLGEYTDLESTVGWTTSYC